MDLPRQPRPLGQCTGLLLRVGQITLSRLQIVHKRLPRQRVPLQRPIRPDREYGDAHRSQHDRRVEPVSHPGPLHHSGDHHARNDHTGRPERQHTQGHERQRYGAPRERRRE
jgi:hypothetical protein